MRQSGHMPSRASLLGAALLCAGLAAPPSAADVTVTAQTTTGGFGLSTVALTVTSIKGLRMRLETTIRGQVLTSLVDLEQARFVSLNHATRTALVIDMRPYAPRLRLGGTVTLTPTGRTQAFGSQACDEYTVEAGAAVTGSEEATARLEVHGVAWVAARGPGRADWTAFHRAVVDRGLFFTDPRVIELDPARAHVIAVVYAGVADRGVPCQTRFEFARAGAGPSGQAMNESGRAVLETSVTDVSSDSLAAELFEIPAGYTLKRE